MSDYPLSNKYYNEHVAELTKQYLSTPFEKVHAPWIQNVDALCNQPKRSVLDVGAASGRDISYISEKAVPTQGSDNQLGVFLAVERAGELVNSG